MTDDRISSRHEILASLQAGRAIAAILVAFFHTGVLIFALDKYWGFDPVRHFFDFGRAGVEFFFVLSGFIILHIHWKDLGHPQTVRNYAAKRFLRIYPIYWVILATVTPVYFIVPSFGLPYQRDPGTILSSFLLMHVDGNSDTILAAAWTLYHEMLFYFFFALAILHKRAGVGIIGLWLLASAATLIATPPTYIVEFLLSPLHLLFAMGMAACWAIHRARIPSPRTVALLGVAIFLAAGMEENYVLALDDMLRNLIYGLGSALTVVGVVTLEREGRLKIPHWLLVTGNASYVIYLINFTVLSLMAKIFVFTGAREALPPLLSYAILVAASVILGIAVHLCIERPLMRFLRGRYNRRIPANTNIAEAPAPLAPENAVA